MKRLLFFLVLAVAACSPGETAESSTTSSTQGSTTTSAEVTTTTAPVTTSTTALSTTTSTTVSDTTTTTTGVEGNWADEPLVTVDFGALGWFDGAGWVSAQDEAALPIVGGEDYQIARIGDAAQTTGGAQTIVCDPLGLVGLELAAPDLLGEFPGPYGVAISAPFVLRPHLFEALPDDGTYSGFAADLLASRGLNVASPVIKQLFRTDLEGDGVNEVIVVAEDVTPGFLMEVGDYSIVFLRKVVQGEVQTAVLAETVVLGEDQTFSGAHSVGGVADLSGDGQMEIITNSAFFEGFSVAVWEYVNDDLGPVLVLDVGCGS